MPPFAAKEWTETEHPRDTRGRFSHSRGGTAVASGFATECSAEEFFDAVGKAMKNPEVAPFLTRHTIEEYRGMRTFLAEDGKVGGALNDGDEIVSVYSNGGSLGAGRRMVSHLIDEGGRRLDCTGDGLRKFYEKVGGFRVTETVKWDDRYAPPGWDYAKRGRPNIYYMERD